MDTDYRIYIHPTAVIDHGSTIGEGCKIWHFCHICAGANIGKNCVLGQNVHIGPNVNIGDGCRIQNNVSIFDGVTLEDSVFVGPSAVFTNVLNPRAEVNQHSRFLPTLVRRGATIGANATILCGSTIGSYAMVGAGSVVTHDVPDFALVYGNPARIHGKVCFCGHTIRSFSDNSCPYCGQTVSQIRQLYNSSL